MITKIQHETMRQDSLPILQSNANEDPGLSRRNFLGHCATLLQGVTVVAVLAPLAAACDTSLEPRDPASGGNNNNNNGGGNGNTATFDVSSLTADGQGILTQKKGPDGYAIMIVRAAAGTYKALSTRCTHQGCDVNAPQNGSITCPCHGSRFALDGAVINGPAAQPLTSYPLTWNSTANTVTITLS